MNSNIKVKRNDKCICGSGKKFKVCCFKLIIPLDYSENNPNSSQFIIKFIDYLKRRFKKHNIIDISHNLKPENYMKYLRNNFGIKTIMIAEKTKKNSNVFINKGSLNGNVIVMFKGAYVCFESDEFESAKNAIKKLVRGRLRIKCPLCHENTENNCCCSICSRMCCFTCANTIINDDENTEILYNCLFAECPFCHTKKGMKFSLYNPT